MTATACPYPFPIRWHRNMAQVIADEGVKHTSRGCNDTAEALRKVRGEVLLETAPAPDHKREVARYG